MQGPFVQQWSSEGAIVGQRTLPLCLRGQGNGKDDRNREGNVLVLMWQRHGVPLGLALASLLIPGKLHMHLLAFCRVNCLKGIFFDMVLLKLVLDW